MNQKGIKPGFLAVKNGHHIQDLLVKPGTMKWDEQVVPGYRFLFDALKIWWLEFECLNLMEQVDGRL
jgi:hypothetical protein